MHAAAPFCASAAAAAPLRVASFHKAPGFVSNGGVDVLIGAFSPAAAS
jgi:hypothetical protein